MRYVEQSLTFKLGLETGAVLLKWIKTDGNDEKRGSPSLFTALCSCQTHGFCGLNIPHLPSLWQLWASQKHSRELPKGVLDRAQLPSWLHCNWQCGSTQVKTEKYPSEETQQAIPQGKCANRRTEKQQKPLQEIATPRVAMNSKTCPTW